MTASATSSTMRSSETDSHADIHVLVEHAAHYLPAQGPIEVFVHHNTLHAFEELSFHDAVKAGQNRYNAEPYLSERELRRHYASGRITDEDLQTAVRNYCTDLQTTELTALGSISDIHLGMLRHPIHVGTDAELRWHFAETDALERFRGDTSPGRRDQIVTGAREWLKSSDGQKDAVDLTDVLARFGQKTDSWTSASWETFALQLLWRICRSGVRSVETESASSAHIRARSLLLQAIGEDVDRYVHSILIRFCAAFVDQGYSDWTMPNREQGLYRSFVALYSTRSVGLESWLKDLPDELISLNERRVSPEQSVAESLDVFGVAHADRQEFITQSLLALGGWAGMIWQLESGVDWVFHSIPKGSLVALLAIQLILDKHAVRHIGREAFGSDLSVADILKTAAKPRSSKPANSTYQQACLLFQVSQMQGWTPQQLLALSASQWQQLTSVIEQFSPVERRRVFQEAFESTYRHAALDAFAKHTERRKLISSQSADRPTFQIVTCIDDREESFRRHLEEVLPQCETFGAAGFFAVAMYYRGAADSFYKPLCPGVITPDHYVQEDVGYSFEGVHQSRTELRRRLGHVSHAFHTRSRGFLGGIATGIVGSLATAPLVARVLFPHLTARIRRRFGSLLQPPPVTKLQLERYAEAPGPENGHVGYSIDEMAAVVVRLLQDIGVTHSDEFSRLFMICGHGSSSLNNPHESAYCCGACAGKRGGPNARAFAQMANDWRVRAKVSQRGINIPDQTFFVGAYHNTCDDSVVFFDLDRLPASHREEFEQARESIEEARRRNAHERCRRFVSAALTISPKEALRHVEARAQDISQARPEYNHATNALCVVGRRDWSRGLFLDRRSFLTSYDPMQDDDESSILFRILSAAIPVCAGINLEYYFSCVDHTVFGSGSKLPHNIVSLLGVMEGTSSDLRTGLYQQMVEIHEPLRLLFLIESTPEAMLSIMERNPTIGRLCRGAWVHLAVINPDTSEIQEFRDGRFHMYVPKQSELPSVSTSLECYENRRDHLPFFSIRETGENQ